jgi:hypothetical protein
MDSSSHLLLQASHGLSLLASLGCQIVLLVVVATVVRRHRPDAHGALLGWAIAALVSAIVLPAVGFAAVAIAGRAGIEAILQAQTATILLNTLAHVALVALLVRGLVKIAQPPKPVQPGAAGPYR